MIKNLFIFGLAVMAVFIAGIFAGRLWFPSETVKTETVYRYRPAKLISEVLPQPVFEKPITLNTQLRLTDTVIIEQPPLVDTSTIIKDYYTARGYELDFSSDSIGIYKVSLTIARNALVKYDSTIQPIERLTTSTVERLRPVPLISPFVSVGSSINFTAQNAMAGIFIKDRVFLGASYLRINNNNGYTLNIGYKF